LNRNVGSALLLMAMLLLAVAAFLVTSRPARAASECVNYMQVQGISGENGFSYEDGDGKTFAVLRTPDKKVDDAVVFEGGCVVGMVEVPSDAIESWLRVNPHGYPGTNRP
jgi:hypothetical protein